ncbi:MAG: hypothetical protein P1U65_17590 [Minwuia sp.]|nr:hypothetical protein [Minwuia sp.]
MPRFCKAYGLTIESDIALPELLAAAHEGGPADITISRGPVRVPAVGQVKQISPFIWVGEDAFWLHVPGVARFSVVGASKITIDPEPGVDEASIRVFLLGSVLGAVLFQRGFLLLHGNAVEVDGGCVICIGPSGVGKSTLAAGFLQRGYRMLADDVVPIDADCAAVPGFPRLKIWQDAAEKMAINTTAQTRVRPDMNKFNLMTRDNFSDARLPVRWIYILSSENRDGFEVQPIHGMHRFAPLRENTYRRRLMEGMALQPEHLKRCGELASKVRLTRLVRPKTGFDIDGLVDTILADIRTAG